MMGSPESEKGHQKDESPVHEVHIAYTFAFSKLPITHGERKRFVDDTGHKDGSDCEREDNRPVVCVSWQDARDYAAWMSRKTGQHYRLPTEAEYEYAARAGTTTAYYWGQDFRYGSADRTNPWGIYGVMDNVWSWTLDCYHDTYARAPTDGSAWETNCSSSYRVIRGASPGNPPMYRRSAFCTSAPSGTAAGFRLVRDDRPSTP
jgi:formylglycine-generating enzyme required for sulfatase activity